MNKNNRTARRPDIRVQFTGTTSEVREMVIDGSLLPGTWDAARLARRIDKETYKSPRGQQFKRAVGAALNILRKEGLVHRGAKRGLYVVPEDAHQPSIATEAKPQPQEDNDPEIGDMLEVIAIAQKGLVVLRDENGTLMVAGMSKLVLP